jgi:hypothetical protein
VDYNALMNEAMNLAFEEALEERGGKVAPSAHKLLPQEGGISCA